MWGGDPPKTGSHRSTDGSEGVSSRDEGIGESLGRKSWLRLLPPRPGVEVTASSRGRRGFRAARSNVDYLGLGTNSPSTQEASP